MLRQPDRWFVLTARVSDGDPLRELLSEGLLALGGLSVLEEADSLTTYLPPPDDPEALLAHAGSFLADWLLDDQAPHLSWRWQDNEDWARTWREGLEPRKLTDRIVVKPTWTEWDPSPGEIVIDIDPQMAFGTGEHATTRGCLRLLDRTLAPGERVLDVGSGSAILSIAAARLGAGEVIAIEYDPDANINARENLDHNGVADRVTLIEAMADEALLAEFGTFDLIVANILSGIIRPLLPAFRAALRPGGRLIVSGIMISEHEKVVADAAAAGLTVVDTEPEEEWWSARMITNFGLRITDHECLL
ncbi:MAG: 50S ribosomal protein L11 methyltransferase [Gemmatimonadetes bacterium]|nr:50S ribosomal protein L11 methyltransferase [Gemmatimonadota bacterium]